MNASSSLRLLTLTALAVCTVLGATLQEPPNLGTQEIMRSKLSHMQRILEGIATENASLVQTNAERLVRLSRLTGWKARQTPEYELFSNEFRRQAEAIAQTARDKDMDAATLSYLQLTFSCTSCHKYMRGSRVAWAR